MRLFAVVSLILFAALFAAALFDHTLTLKAHDLLFYGGLGSLAAAFVPLGPVYRRDR